MTPFKSAGALTQAVRTQYEDYPYPPRNPADEQHRLLRSAEDMLPLVNHWCFGGQETFQNGFRVLVAGGGVGDAAIYLAEQLKETDAQIVYLDLSAASLALAKERAAVRGLSNIVWMQDSLLNLPHLGLGPFDYINCSGVLHHLEDPHAGLGALQAVLKPTGALACMVYGTYGRTAIYPLQKLMGLITKNMVAWDEKISAARHVLAHLAPGHWYRKDDPFRPKECDETTDAGLVDLLLHAQDVPFDVSRLHGWLGDAQLRLVRFVYPLGKQRIYDPLTLLRNTQAGEKVEKLPIETQHAVAELLYGNLAKHAFYAVGQENPMQPAAYGENMIPSYTLDMPDINALRQFLQKKQPPEGRPITINHPILGPVPLPSSHPDALPTALACIDGVKTCQAIADSLHTHHGLSLQNAQEFLKSILQVGSERDWVVLKKKGIATI